MHYLDVISKSAVALIALCNIILTISLFFKKSKKDDNDKEKDRKISYLKVLVLDHSLKYFYEFFESNEKILELLKQVGLSDDDKKKIDLQLSEQFTSLRRKFIDGLLAIDQQLYDNVLDKMDALQAHFTNSIFDPGINLAHTPKFNDTISDEVAFAKTEVIKILFSYRG